MREIFVNLKRFEVPKSLGGLCPVGDPVAWIESVMAQTVDLGLGQTAGLRLTYLLPEGSLVPALRVLASYPAAHTASLAIGCQGVHWKDITPGGNFGAFTSSLPATAARSLGCTWAIIGHSEERRAKLEVMQAVEPHIVDDEALRQRAAQGVSALIGAEVGCALQAGLHVLLCVGETAEERGDGPFEAQQPRVEAVIDAQLTTALAGAKALSERGGKQRIVIGYEPVWAIGPGRVPPGREYIAFISALVKRIVQARLDMTPAVVYGGGLKEENAAMIAGIETIDGGLVALTRFTGEIGFDVPALRNIVAKYLA